MKTQQAIKLQPIVLLSPCHVIHMYKPARAYHLKLAWTIIVCNGKTCCTVFCVFRALWAGISACSVFSSFSAETRRVVCWLVNAWGDAMSVRLSVRTSLGGVALPSISKCRAERAQIHLRRRRREHTRVSCRGAQVFPSAPKPERKQNFFERRDFSEGRGAENG